MTRKIGNIVHIEVEPSRVCAFCEKVAELRPYGPNDEEICFDCAMQDEETMKKKFQAILNGSGEKTH